MYANPLVSFASDIEESSAVPDISDLLIFVHVFVEERFNLFFVDIPHLLRRNRDYIAILIASVRCEFVDILLIRDSVVEDSEFCEIFFGNFPTGIVEFALIALVAAVSLKLGSQQLSKVRA